MTNVTTTSNGAGRLEEVLMTGNLKNLTTTQRLEYYEKLCDSLKLNPLTKPFEYITLNGKEVLYATKGATDQLRKVNSISIYKLEKFTENDVHIVTAYARDGEGREDVSTGAVSINNLKGEGLANAYLKAETKAKRRVTLSIGGLGMLDETEIESIREASPKSVEQPRDVTAYAEKDGMFNIDGEYLSGIDVHNLILKTLDSVQTAQDIRLYNDWKAKNREGMIAFSKKNREVCATYTDILAQKEKELTALDIL